MIAVPDTSADRAAVERAVDKANLPTLLMVLFHLTGEARWLSAEYRPTRMKGLDENDSGGFSSERQAEIKRAAAHAICEWSSGAPVQVPSPSSDVVLAMLETSMGESVPPEYGAMMRAELGLDPVEQPNGSSHPIPDGFLSRSLARASQACSPP